MSADRFSNVIPPLSQTTPTMPLIANTTVRPAPGPTEIALAEVAASNGQKLIAMQLATPLGVNFFFLDLATAKQVGEQLQAIASGIVVAAAGSIR